MQRTGTAHMPLSDEDANALIDLSDEMFLLNPGPHFDTELQTIGLINEYMIDERDTFLSEEAKHILPVAKMKSLERLIARAEATKCTFCGGIGHLKG